MKNKNTKILVNQTRFGLKLETVLRRCGISAAHSRTIPYACGYSYRARYEQALRELFLILGI